MKVIIAAVLGLLLINGAGMVQAEKAVIDVPFDSRGTSCWYDEISVEYHCTWQGVVEVFTLEDLQKFKDILPEKTYDQEIERLNQKALEEIAIEQAKLTPDEKIIQKLELRLEKGIIDTPDAVLLQMLRDLDECQQGLGNSAAIQDERNFVISQYQNLEVHNVKIEGQLGKLSLAVQECKAQYTLENKILTPAYKHFSDADKAGSFDHRGMLADQAVPFEKFTATSRNIDMRAICENPSFSKEHRSQAGCEMLYDGKTMQQIKLENESRFGTDGTIGYESELLGDYFEFLNSYGNRQATSEDKREQEIISEPIVQKMFEDNHFYKNSLK